MSAAWSLVLLLPVLSTQARTCQHTNFYADYTNTTEYLTFNAPKHSPRYDLKLSDGRYGGDYPDCISFNGTRAKNLGATGVVQLDASKATGYMEVEFNATLTPESRRGPLSGHWRIRSTNFIPTVPFTRNGISQNFIQHGCTKQGEPGFPQVKAYFSTWGNCDVYLNREILYSNIWLHTMYTNRFHDPNTNAIWADAERDRAYSPARCWEGDVRDDEVEFSFIVARWCKSPDPQVHALTDVNIVMTFPGVKDVSPPP